MWSTPEVLQTGRGTVMHTSGPEPGDVLGVGRYEVNYLAVDNDNEDTPSASCKVIINVQGKWKHLSFVQLET